MNTLTVATFNMHKGMSALNRHVRVAEIGTALAGLGADLIFLQEVQGKHQLRALNHSDWPHEPQHHYLAQRLKQRAAYGVSAVYEHGHHGNAVLSHFPFDVWEHLDMSVNPLESRVLVSCLVSPPGWNTPIIALCAHLNLLGYDRRKQYRVLAHYVREVIPPDMPLILAGDFNDWRSQASSHLGEELGLVEAFEAIYGAHALSFPARLPLLPLDRIYLRGLVPIAAHVHRGQPWSQLSDHLPLTAQLMPVERHRQIEAQPAEQSPVYN
jgi:endonuclease/exonuclease/phosphatase family metal-dependent hydrolase